MTTKKVTRKKAAPKPSLFGKLENSFIAVPFKVANKTFLASLGLFSVVQKELSTKFDEYAKDGEKVRDDFAASFKGLRKDVTQIKEEVRDVVEEAKDVADKVRDTFDKAA